MLNALHRKLLRELMLLKGQISTIALVVASGIASFVALRGAYEALESSRAAYYEACRFADVFAHAERVPESLSRRLEAIPGVLSLETRIVEEVTLPIEGMQRPAYGRLMSLPRSGTPETNALHLRSGAPPQYGRDEVVVLESFADAHGLRPGHRIPVVVNGKLRRLRIAGVALSPEFVFAIRPGALTDDPKRYAVLWMERGALASALQFDGAFNDVSLRLQPGAVDADVRAQVDGMLRAYGGDGAYGRKDQLSNRVLTQELGQLSALSGMVPLVFLGVEAFLVNLVLGRLIRLQRQEIATLKAVGYSNGEVGRHYVALVAVVVIVGGVAGVTGGWVLGDRILGLYANAFRFPALEFSPSTGLIAFGLLVTAAAALAGAWLAVRGAVKLPPAEAMRPPAPPRYRRGLLERLGLGTLVGPSGAMVLREIERRPLRTALSAVGVAGAVALLIFGRFGWDSLMSYFEGTFQRENRHDLAVTFSTPMTPRVVGQLARMPGVVRAEGIRAVPVRVRHEHRVRQAVVMGLPSGGTLRRLVERGGSEVAVPADGVVLTKVLGDVLSLRIGDRAEIELREGERRTVRPVVVGFVDESIGLQVYARDELLAKLEGDLGAVSSVLLAVESTETAAFEARLLRSPHVLDVVDLESDMQRSLDMNASIMDVWTAVSIALSVSVIFGVVYNNARIALAARSRELATLRVVGFHRAEISSILLAGLAVEIGIAIPLGLVWGRLWAEQFMRSVDQETFRWAVVIAPSTYVLTVAVTLAAAAVSALWVRRGLDRLDLVSVLKERE